MAESKEVDVKPKSEVATIDDATLAEMEAATAKVRGTLDLAQDVRLPQLRLVQATSADLENAKAGQIFDSLASVGHDEVEIVLISTWKTRAHFGGGNIGDPPDCTSPDAARGYGVVADRIKAEGKEFDGAGDCLKCPEADWRTGGKCQLRYNYLTMLLGEGTDPENELPRGVMMHGTSAKVASRLNTMLLSSKFIWSNVLALSSHTEKNDRGQYKVWDVRRIRATTPAEQLLAFNWYRTLDQARSVTIADTDGAETPSPSGDEDIPF
jgi:hypothetical protein